MTDYAARRTMMVDTQIRTSDVTKFPVIDAMLRVPREAFVPRQLREAAYVGENLALGDGRVLLQPRTLAKMLDALDIEGNEMVLDVGSALGYSAAVMAQLAQVVIALEEDGEMASEAPTMLLEQGIDNVVIHEAPLTGGAPEHGPYDVIVVQGGVQTVPDAIIAQLKDGGRIACLFMEGTLGVVRIGYKIDGHMNWRYAFNASAPVLPGFEQETAFAL
ncbi:protein-L-isoaspartate O-methyltransferase [Roseovarius spongiae]|uniref:Protein-L-isoaspartate O-methyltransferase n=1 Tax=Roseovarius spongiae TaxID=2320272 RepID=A0A3A8ASH5_9RHOB|nr:protein-L-isoaspartate O-methyltransferase [Roseovarius spongiae]RKF14112.1 protein-L-isoaspartate O-methyltransferase [Roseovarius spongiae]